MFVEPFQSKNQILTGLTPKKKNALLEEFKTPAFLQRFQVYSKIIKNQELIMI
jgi:hypothetical protein